MELEKPARRPAVFSCFIPVTISLVIPDVVLSKPMNDTAALPALLSLVLTGSRVTEGNERITRLMGSSASFWVPLRGRGNGGNRVKEICRSTKALRN